MCCTWLAENTGRKNDAKNRHLGTMRQLCRAISSQLRYLSTIEKKLVTQQYLLHVSSQYGELRPVIVSGVWGTPGTFNGFRVLAALLHGMYSSGRQPNFTALNRGRHLCLAGRPSRWALAHISSLYFALAAAAVVQLHEPCSLYYFVPLYDTN